MKLYLDVSCLNRPFDDQTQSRIRRESEAVTLILEAIDAGTWKETSSRMVEMEISVIPDETRRRRVLELVPRGRIELTATVFDRAKELLKYGFGAADAVHLAAAEHAGADVMLSCDDRLIKRAGRIADELKVRVVNPADWLKEQNDATNAR
jgi:predicted nucleic acid-binding protein